MFVVVIGPAAAGKSSIAEILARDGVLINLDAATPSKAEIDIRKWVKVEELQEKYRLGINGALLKSMELIASMDEWISEDKNEFKVVDTPGQLEIFMYHDFGKKIIEKLSKHDIISCIFVVDAQEISSIENYLAMLAQNAMINLKLLIPCITAINKIDMVDKSRLLKYMDIRYIEEKIEEGDALLKLAKGLIDYIEYTSIVQRPLLVSAKTGDGIDDLFAAIHEVHCSCGDIS
ncbi:MAG: ATP/GTP-binding protein [Thermoplasmata archaeon]|nr:ATP/GTP-binding protein [Thermoplasmata archaeon]